MLIPSPGSNIVWQLVDGFQLKVSPAAKLVGNCLCQLYLFYPLQCKLYFWVFSPCGHRVGTVWNVLEPTDLCPFGETYFVLSFNYNENSLKLENLK